MDVVPARLGKRRVRLWAPGPLGAVSEAVLVCLPKPLAGMGTRRQVDGVIEGISRLLRGTGRPFGYVGPAIGDGPLLLAEPFVEIEPHADVAESYRRVQAAFERAFTKLLDAGVARTVVLSMGYTSYGPEGVKRALATLATRGTSHSAIVCLVDSAYPDVDVEECETDDDGWPTGRFHSRSYRSDEFVDTLFFLTSSYDYDLRLLDSRAPRGLSGAAVIAPPYSSGYLNRVEKEARAGRESGLAELADLVSGLQYRRPHDLVIPIVASDIWSEGAVGTWMTTDEHSSCLNGTRALIRALELVARRLERRIFVPIDRAGAKFLSSTVSGSVAILGSTADSIPPTATVVITGYFGLSQDSHSRLLGASDLAISRTGGQANATAVLAIAGTPTMVVDMPAVGYMQSELTSHFMTHDLHVQPDGTVNKTYRLEPLAWRARGSDSPETLAGVIRDALENDAERLRRRSNARAAFQKLRESPRGSIFSHVRRLVGLAGCDDGVLS